MRKEWKGTTLGWLPLAPGLSAYRECRALGLGHSEVGPEGPTGAGGARGPCLGAEPQDPSLSSPCPPPSGVTPASESLILLGA